MANELDQITGGLEENIALSNIRKQKAEEQANQHEQLRSEFDDYARGGTGDPLDMNRVEAYKNQVPSHMFQASLYKLQEETYPVGESFSTPILDKYVGDDPNAYKDYEAYDNRQASMNRAYRIKDYHYGMFTYDSRADYPNMNDEAYEIMSVGGYFSEMYNKPMDEVVKNMDTYVGMYGNQKNIKDPNIKSVFDQIKGEVFDMGESMKRDDQYWSEGLDMALRGDSIEKTVTGKLGTPEGDRQAQVYRMAADYIYGEYGNNIIKAKEYLTLLGEGDKRPETLDARKPSGAEVQGRLAMANQLMGESPEDRQEILSLIFKLAELEGEEVEGAVNRVAKSMQRAISGSIEDITSGSTKALLDPNVFIPKALEIKDDKIAEPLRQRTELMQDLRMARNIYKDIEAQGTGEMIAQTTAANIHYAGMFALGWSGFGAMALDMASKRDEQLRIEYPDMSPDTRWSISQADAVVDASLERFKYKMVFSGFPTLTKFVGGTGVKRAAGVFGVRVASAQATNYAEEVAQNMTNPIFHKMWVAAGADIPDVTQEDWDRNFWMMEDGDKVPFIDGELFVSLLGMSMLGAGGRGAYDKFGGANVKRILDEKDKLLLQGFPEAQADAIIKANQTDTTKAFEMFQDGLEDMSQQERRANMNQAKADGADRRVLKAELDEYKQRVEEDGTEEDKANLRVREKHFDLAMKYDAHLEEREDGRWDFVSPNTDFAPNQTFETKEQADEAMLQHYHKVDQIFLSALSEQAQRIDAINREAMDISVKEIKEAQAKAGVEADIALDQDLTTLAEFGAQSKKNMEIALERVQHELLRKNILRPATVKDLEAWTINAQVTLAKNGRGYVQKVAKGGNIADVYEDASEGFLKTMIHKDVVSKDWVKEQLFKYQKDSGDSVKWGFKSVEDITDGRMVEAFSDLAKANLWNASKDNKMGKLSSLIRALKQFFKSILDAAESLLKLQAEGKIDTDFQTLLDQSVGLNMDEQIARQTEEVRQEILGETTFSISDLTDAQTNNILEGSEYIRPEEVMWDDTISGKVVIGAYSGSTHQFKKLKNITGNIEGNWGAAVYASTEIEDVNENYAGEGADLTSRIEQRAERIAGETEDDFDSYDEAYESAKVIARQELSGTGGGQVYPMYIPMGNPAVIADDGGTYFDPNESLDLERYREEAVELVLEEEGLELDDVEDYMIDDKMRELSVEAGDMNAIDEAVDTLSNQYENVDTNAILTALSEYALEGGRLSDIEDALRSTDEVDYITDSEGNLASGEFIREFFMELGFDGIIDKRVTSKFPSMQGMNENTVHIIVPYDTKNRPRSAFNPDITFSIAQDATYLDLAKNPDKNRAELQAMVDARAKAAGYDSPKVYHGTNANAYSDQDFTVFATNQERGASFFSSSEDLASSYGEQVYSIRLKLENPFIVDAKGGGWSSLGDADIISELSPEYLKFKDDQLKDNAELLKRIGKLLGTDMDSTVSVDEAQTKKVGDLSGSRNDIDWVGKFARKYGYDGAIVKNVKDAPLATGYDNPIQDTYLAFNPNQIKSADPVTYDSDGNVIPLSQRFDAGRDEVSFSIGRADITPTANTQTFPTKDGGVIGEASFSIGAWHGTPHKVDKFRTEQIGTGEGAQAYGWGLYFAESEGVAEGYRSKLSQDLGAGKGELTALAQYSLRGKTTDDALSTLKEALSTMTKAGAKSDFIQKYEDAIESIEVAAGIKKLGALYQVELNVEQDELLDWDKPLSEQSEKVQGILGNIHSPRITTIKQRQDESGAWLYEFLQWDVRVEYNQKVKKINEKLSELAKTSDSDAQAKQEYDALVQEKLDIFREVFPADDGEAGSKQASEALSALGIKGIKYLDGDSRGAGEGTYNYVIFNDKDIRITEENGNVVDTTMSIAPAEDAVMARITSLMRDPDAKLEVYKNMASRLNKVRERVYAKHIAYGGVTAASMREADKEMDDREFIVASVAQIQAIASVLPADVRVKMGSIEGLVKRSTTRGVTNEMLKKIDKLDNALDKHLSDHYLAKLNKSVKQGKVKKRAGEKVARGTITAIKHDEHDLIVGVMKMTDEQIEKAIAENEAVLINPQTDEANATDAVVNIIRLQTFGKLTKEGKRPQANATTMKEASDQLAKLIADGKAAYAVLQEEKKERRAGMKSEMVDVVSGGKGVPDSDVKSRAKTKRSKQGLRNIVLEQKVKMNSWEHLVEHLSRLDPSPSMQSKIRVWTEKVHRATHAESQAVAEKQVMFEKTVAEIYGVDTNKRNWYVNTLPHFEKLAKPKERDISKAYDNTKQVVSVQPDHAQELLMGVSDVILIDEGLVKVTEADLKAIQEQVDKHPNAKTYKFTRQEHKGVKKVYLSTDQILNLTMLYGQEGYKDVMHFHGYSEEVMKQLEKELSPKDKQLRSFMLAYNDKNYDYFNNVYSKVFGVNMRKIKNYSKGSFEHQGQQPVELMDAQGATAMSVAPSAGMSRIQHLAEPKQDAGAIPLFLEGIRETEHFVAWGELIGDMRATFLNKEVQDTITVYHGDELRQRINSDIEEFTQGGVTVTSNNRNKLLDKLRTDFTVMSLAYKWGIVIKQWTSLPAYASHIPMTDYLKYQAEIMKSLDNFKKIKDLPYTQHRFNKGYDRDVMIILNHSQKKSKLERVAEFGMKGVSIGDITPVIIGGYAAYRHGYEQAKKANPDAGEAFWEDRGILAFEMLTDNAQQSGQMKDLSGWAKGSSLARVMTMYSSSLIQYTNNQTTAILDVISGKVDSKKKLAKIAFINHVLLPSSFYWVSWFTANLFKDDEDKESAEEAINGWIASMMLGPFSGVFVFGRGLASIASGYRYDLPVLSGIESGARAAHKMWNMAFDDEPLTPDDFLEALDYTADAYAFTVGKGLGKAYEISKNIAKSFGFDRYDARRMAMTDVDRAVYDLSKLKKAIYAEEMPEETDKRAYKKAQHDRWNLLADEYDYIREVNESDWDAIKKKLQSKGLLPKEVEKRMRR